jgi:atlastin
VPLRQKIQRFSQDNLPQLALFSEYARMAVEANQVLKQKDKIKPFQRFELLVRDWQHFEEEVDYDIMVEEMQTYFDKVSAERDAKNLQETREQIVPCFETVSCLGLCRPGMAVIKRYFAGDVKKMENNFIELLDPYC